MSTLFGSSFSSLAVLWPKAVEKGDLEFCPGPRIIHMHVLMKGSWVQRNLLKWKVLFTESREAVRIPKMRELGEPHRYYSWQWQSHSLFSEALLVSPFLPLSLLSADLECFSVALT